MHPADSPLGSARSRAAARALLLSQPIFVVDFGTLPMPVEDLPTYEELLRDWDDQDDRYTHEERVDSTLFRSAILKDSEAFRRIKARRLNETERLCTGIDRVQSCSTGPTEA
jgi:hypothetical protein